MTKICHCPKNQKGYRKEELTREIEKKVRDAKVSALGMTPVVKTKMVHTHIGGSKFLTAFLSSAIVLLMFATSWLAYSKYEMNDLNKPNIVVTHNQRKEVKPDYLTKSEAETMMGQIQSRIDGLEQQMQTWNHRAWLLALAVNENANIAQGIDNRYHRCYPHRGYITFDKNWNISRVPSSMRLTEEEKLKILNGVE